MERAKCLWYERTAQQYPGISGVQRATLVVFDEKTGEWSRPIAGLPGCMTGLLFHLMPNHGAPLKWQVDQEENPQKERAIEKW